MKKYSIKLLLIISLTFCARTNAQDAQEIEIVLEKLITNDSTQALNKFLSWNVETVDYNLLDPKTPEVLKKLKKGATATIKVDNAMFVYSFINKTPFEQYRANYIFLDGNVHSKSKIDSLRVVIFDRYRSGIHFEDLAKEFTMDGNSKGELDWFKKGHMILVFEEAVRDHKLNEIFTVDIPEKNWYYITLKTYDNRLNSKLSFYKIKIEE